MSWGKQQNMKAGLSENADVDKFETFVGMM